MISSFSKNLHGFSSSALSVFHNHLDVIGSQTGFIEILSRSLNLRSRLSSNWGVGLCFFSFRGHGVLELIDLTLSGLEAVHVGLSKDDVRVLVSGSFPDIRIINADDKGLALLDGDSVDAGDWLESHLGHSLLEFLLSSVGFGIKIFTFVFMVMIVIMLLMMMLMRVFMGLVMMLVMLMIVIAVLSMDMGDFLLDFFSHNSNESKLNIKILINNWILMTSEQQYYEAKVFLTAYNDALRTLDEIAANRATIEKYKAYERYLLSGANKGEIHIEGNTIRAGTYFYESKIRQLGQFSKSLFSKDLAAFDSIRTYGDLKKVLQSYL